MTWLRKQCCSRFIPKNEIEKDIKLSINNITIKDVNCSKYLGVMIDNKLMEQYHINSV